MLLVVMLCLTHEISDRLGSNDSRFNADFVQQIHEAHAARPGLVKQEAVFSAMTNDFLNTLP